MATCDSVAARQVDFSERVGRASRLLSTRVDIVREQQNQALLASMNRRARLQLRLQQTVEGLSIAAITYYGVGLVGYLAKGARRGARRRARDRDGHQHSDRGRGRGTRHAQDPQSRVTREGLSRGAFPRGHRSGRQTRRSAARRLRVAPRAPGARVPAVRRARPRATRPARASLPTAAAFGPARRPAAAREPRGPGGCARAMPRSHCAIICTPAATWAGDARRAGAYIVAPSALEERNRCCRPVVAPQPGRGSRGKEAGTSGIPRPRAMARTPCARPRNWSNAPLRLTRPRKGQPPSSTCGRGSRRPPSGPRPAPA